MPNYWTDKSMTKDQQRLADGREARIIHSLVLDMVHNQEPEVRYDLQMLLGGFDFNTFVDRLQDGTIALVPLRADDGAVILEVTVPTDDGRQAMGAVDVETIGPLLTQAATSDLSRRAREFERQIGVSDE